MWQQLIGAGLQKKGDGANKREAERFRKELMDYLNKLDAGGHFKPEFASDHTPTFQRSQSPVARSFLESLIGGTNPAFVDRNHGNADIKRQEMQQKENAIYGTPEERAEMQRKIFAEQPWKVDAPDTSRLNDPLPQPNKRKTNNAQKWVSTIFDPLDFRGSGEQGFSEDLFAGDTSAFQRRRR